MQEEQTQMAGSQRGDVKVILVVEDDEAIGEVIQLALAEEATYAVILAKNAQEAFSIASTRQPNLFLIDYHLTDMNGITLYDRLHALPDLGQVPAIIMSASLEKHEQELQERGLTGLAKPFELNDLSSAVARALGM